MLKSKATRHSLVKVRDQRPLCLGFRSSTLLIASVIGIAFFTDGFVYGIVVPVLPFSLHDRSDVPDDQLQFWSSALLAVHGGTMFISSPIAGFFADRGSSRQVPFLTGLALTFAATILFAASKAPGLLVLARCLQGASAGVVYTVGLALLVDTVGREAFGQWMGFVMIGFNVGTLLGPLVGGIIYTKLGYWPVFIVVLAVVGLDFILRLFMVEKSTAAKWEKGKPAPKPTIYGSIPTIYDENHRPIDPDSEIQRHSSSSNSADQDSEDGETTSLLSSHSSPSITSTTPSSKSTGFLSSHFPIMVSLLESKRLMAAVFGSFINTSLTCAFDSVLPLFVKKTFGWNPTAAGLIFLTIAFPSILGPLAGALSDRFGPRPVALGGFALATPAVGLLGLVRDESVHHQVLLGVLLTVVGVGSSMVYAPLGADMSVAIDGITAEKPHLFTTGGAYAQAFSLFDAAIALGTIFGPVWAGWVYHVVGWWEMALTLAVVCASGAVPVALYTGRTKSVK